MINLKTGSPKTSNTDLAWSPFPEKAKCLHIRRRHSSNPSSKLTPHFQNLAIHRFVGYGLKAFFTMLRGAVALLLVLACFLSSIAAYPLCAKNLEAPGPSNTNLTFCSSPEYIANGCCNANDDAQIQATFEAMSISDPTCGAFMKQVLCSKCDQYSADLYGASQATSARPVPYLCSNGTDSYCNQLWNACFNVTITNSPFQQQTPSKAAALNSLYKNNQAFCTGKNQASCFNGTPLKLPEPVVNTPPSGMCLERLDNASQGYYLNLIPHPDGSDRVFVNTQDGLMYMAKAKDFAIDYGAPFLNISHRTDSNNELGFMGIAFHPNYLNNGRLFVSYDCDTTKWPDCAAECGCGGVNLCTRTNTTCRYSAIVAEYTVNATGVTPKTAVQAQPEEVRRIFSYGLPYENHHAGGLWFGPVDKHLYYPLGDGGSADDPWNNGQNLNIPLGKMMRLDVDNFPASTSGLFGNYSIPTDNPFYGVNNTRGEIWAYGLRNPWRCSFDKQNPSYFYCADVGQDTIEEVDLISKGGNYGWRVYEGTNSFKPSRSPGGVTAADSINAIMPIIEYNHSSGISICGGYVSYSRQDACTYGTYLYGDLNGRMWSAYENPASSGRYAASDLPYKCSSQSPVPCNNGTNLGGIISYGEDSKGDIYILAVNGAYRMVNPGLCNITCTDELPPAPSTASSFSVMVQTSVICLVVAFYVNGWA